VSDLSVRFQEPTVGGLTGEQLCLLREIQERNQRELGDDRLCLFEFFPKDEKGPAEYCDNEAEPWSDYCSDHIPEQDDYDIYRDREFE
jgi:hypothetical protein